MKIETLNYLYKTDNSLQKYSRKIMKSIPLPKKYDCLLFTHLDFPVICVFLKDTNGAVELRIAVEGEKNNLISSTGFSNEEEQEIMGIVNNWLADS